MTLIYDGVIQSGRTSTLPKVPRHRNHIAGRVEMPRTDNGMARRQRLTYMPFMLAVVASHNRSDTRFLAAARLTMYRRAVAQSRAFYIKELQMPHFIGYLQ